MKVTLSNRATLYVTFYKRHVFKPKQDYYSYWVPMDMDPTKTVGDTIQRYISEGYETSYRTYCQLRYDDTVIARGSTVLNTNDKPNRFTGKRIALERALKQSPEHYINEKDKPIIWSRFMEEFGHLNR